MALSKYDLTCETTNFAREAQIILGPCTGLLQDILKRNIPESTFVSNLKTFITNHTNLFSKEQLKVAMKGNYSDFDISLLYCLLRNMCSIPQHTNNWGNYPSPVDRSLSANIERIRFLRNKYGHGTSFSLSDSEFQKEWDYIFQIIKELEGYLGTGTDYQETLSKLKHSSMDPKLEKNYIEKLLVVEDLRVGFSDLKGKKCFFHTY